ncbi:hypothetical protein ScalyP_jg11378 [Parmales sp. scaly parma]|nr:hypothetical protein ScalyP_jg11378 [Parmales sp. scaly parma]
MSRWGDEENEDFLPATKVTLMDEKGIKIKTSYKLTPGGNKIKITEKIRVVSESVRTPLSVVERQKNWVRFGESEGLEGQNSEDLNITIQSKDDVRIEDPNDEAAAAADEDGAKALAGNLNAFWAKQQRRQLERKYDVDGEPEEGDDEDPAGNTDGRTMTTPWAAGVTQAGGKYVPPSARGGGAGPSMGGGKGGLEALSNKLGDAGAKTFEDDRDQNTIRVTNISEDTTEADLQELFSPFGRISRVYLAKDRKTMTSRGFAFISFVHHEDAAKAMEKLQGFGYDHLILKLEWARPSGGKADAGGETTTFRSGYGQKLAQDTNEKVSYASNLTANK